MANLKGTIRDGVSAAILPAKVHVLTAEQKHHFETFGFLILRKLFSAEEIDLIRREGDRVFTANRQGKPFPGERRQAIIPFFEKSPELPFIYDDRIHAIAEGLLGPDYILNATEGNLHVGDTQWHGGGPEGEVLKQTKIAFYLEPTTRNTGALRLIPGSHKAGFSASLQPLNEQHDDPSAAAFGIPADRLPCFVFESKPGDIGVFTEHTWHAAFGGSPGRYQHAINFHEHPRNQVQWRFLEEHCAKFRYSLHVPEELLACENLRVRNMIAPIVGLGVGPPEPTPLFE